MKTSLSGLTLKKAARIAKKIYKQWRLGQLSKLKRDGSQELEELRALFQIMREHNSSYYTT